MDRIYIGSKINYVYYFIKNIFILKLISLQIKIKENYIYYLLNKKDILNPGGVKLLKKIKN